MSETPDSNATVGGIEISAALDGEVPDEVLGYLTMVTTGDNMLIPRDWLHEEWDRLDIPESLFPKNPRPWMAYSRAMNVLLDRQEEEEVVVGGENKYRVRFSLDSGDGKEEHLVAHVFFPEAEIGESGGKWVDRNLGFFDYQREDEDDGFPPLRGNETVIADVDGARMTAVTKVEEGSKLHDRWSNRFVSRAVGLFKKMQDHQIGQDMRDVIDDFLFHRSNTVRYQNGAYFVGAGHMNTIDALAEVWDRMNEYKTRGQESKIRTVPVVNTAEQRQYIKEEVWDELTDRINSAVDEALQALEEKEEEEAEQLAKEVLEVTSDAEDFAQEYNQLLETKMDIEEILKERRSGLTDEKEELLNRVIEQQKVGDF